VDLDRVPQDALTFAGENEEKAAMLMTSPPFCLSRACVEKAKGDDVSIAALCPAARA
jgi:hypothetical protein